MELCSWDNERITVHIEPVELPYETCACCGRAIHYGNALYEQEPCVEIDGAILCEDCIESYVLRNYYKKLEVL